MYDFSVALISASALFEIRQFKTTTVVGDQNDFAIISLIQTYKNFERLLFIRTSFHCSSWQFQTISIHFRVFYAVPHEKVRKMKLCHTHCPDLTNKQ